MPRASTPTIASPTNEGSSASARSAASGYLPLTASIATGRPPSSCESNSGSMPNSMRDAPSSATARDAIELHRPQVGVVLHGDEVAALAQHPLVPDGEQRAHQQRGDPGMQPLSVHRQNWK